MKSHSSDKSMKIAHLSRYDFKGGAARSAYRLHLGLRLIGKESSMVVLNGTSRSPNIEIYTPQKSFASRLRRLIRSGLINLDSKIERSSHPARFGLFSPERSKYGLEPIKDILQYHLINLHWISGFIDYGILFSQMTSRRLPLVWTLHDMNAFTGGCHYDYGCQRFIDTCGRCPQLGSNKDHDLSFRIWNRKRKALDQIDSRQLHIVTPSKWLGNQVKQSSLFKRISVSVIPYGIDTQLFTPRNRGLARDALEIPQNARVLLFVADAINSPQKGFPIFVKALEGLTELDDLHIVSLGKGNPAINGQFPHLHLGHVSNERLLSLIYSAADIFVIPSLQDNLPNTVLESLSCGTPIVGFNEGGIPDMVRDGITGFLAQPQDITSLQAAITKLLKEYDLEKMSVSCRNVAINEYTLELQATRYLKLYESCLHSFASL